MTDQERAAATAAMWALLDAEPVRALFPDATKWTGWRYAQRSLLEGSLPEQWNSDKLRGPVPWEDRAALFGVTIDLYLEAVTSPARRPNDPPPRLADLLRFQVIPRRYDPFRQRTSGAALAGTEHARAAAAGMENPGAGRVHHPHRSTALAPIDTTAVQLYHGATEAEVMAWAAEHVEEAKAVADDARAHLGLPESVAIGDRGRGMLLRSEYLRRLGELRARTPAGAP